MKNIAITTYLAILTFVAFPQNVTAQSESKLDSVQVFTWDHVLLPNDFLIHYRFHYTYGNGGVLPTNILYLQKDITTPFTWLNNLQFIRTYTVDDKIESNIQQIWGGGVWINFIKQEYSYDGFGNNDVITGYNHDGLDWFLVSQDLMTYDLDNLITEAITQQWTGVDWLNSQKYTYTNVGGFLMQKDHYTWAVTDWAPADLRNIYTYNGSNQLETDTFQIYTGSDWLNNGLTTNMYTGDNITELIAQVWTGIWENSVQQLNTYDGNNLHKEQLANSWSGSAWIPGSKIKLYWSDTNLGLASNNLFKGKAYPNPFHNTLTISLKSGLEINGLLQIFDINGKEISKTELNQGVKSLSINNPHLSKGLYFIHVTSGKEKSVFKVIKH